MFVLELSRTKIGTFWGLLDAILNYPKQPEVGKNMLMFVIVEPC